MPSVRTASLPILAVFATTFFCSASAQDVLTFHNDAARSAIQSNETILTPSNVNSNLFGKSLSFSVDGDVYAQPLYVGGYSMPDGRTHNLLLVATAHDTVYAFDADGNNPSGGYLWHSSLLAGGETWVTVPDVVSDDINPAIGITGTPVIDRSTGTIYVVAKSKTSGGATVFSQRLHALNLADGSEKFNGPTNIQATLNGSGDGGSTVSFSPLLNNNRAALLLAPTPQGPTAQSIVIAWASHGDNGRYRGWVISYNAADISQQTGAWVDTPNGTQGGIWMSAGGLSTDGTGNVFGAAGNGTFDANSAGADYGDSLFKLNLTAGGLSLGDWFTPVNQAALDGSDGDFGVGGAPLILPNQSGPYPHLMVTADKQGQIYLLNRDNLGHYNNNKNSDIQDFDDGGRYQIKSNLAFFNNSLYLIPTGGPAENWAFNSSAGVFNTTPQSKSTHSFGCNQCDGGGSNFTISANGTGNGIVWALDDSNYGSAPSVLYAFDASHLSNELYNSSQASNNRDQGPLAIKFTSPTVANGHVYVGGRNSVVVYGSLGNSPQSAAAPSFSPAGGTFTTAQTVSISDATPGASIHYTLDGSTPTAVSPVYSSPLSVSTNKTINALAVASGYNNSPVSSVAFKINSQLPTPSFSPGGGTFSAAQTVSIIDAMAGVTIHYTIDGSTPTPTSPVYSSPLAISTATTLNAIATAGNFPTSAVASAAYKITSAVATPSFSPGGGSFGSSQNVAISDATAGTAIYYTLDGSAPTAASRRYTAALSISSTTTVKAIAINSANATSAVAAATYTISSGSPASAPSFEPGGGTYASGLRAKITAVSPGAQIYYTTDGSTPTPASQLYTAQITITSSETLRAIVTAPGHSASSVGSVNYTITGSSASTAAPSFSPASGSYNSAVSVTIADATANANIFYTTDGSTPTISSQAYTGPINISSSTTLSAMAFASGYNASPATNATYTISTQQSAAAPSFSPAPALYTSAQSVAISDVTPGAVIHYTTDGSAPTASSPSYSGPITIASNTTLSAIAVASGYGNSPASSGTYTITTGGGTAINYGGGFTGAAISLNGSATLSGNRLRLTDGGAGEAGSAYSSSLVNVQQFKSSFTFQLTKDGADGFTFVIQNAGPSALGLKGGGLGYGPDNPGGTPGIGSSIALKFDLYNNAGETSNSTGLYTLGASPTVPSIDLGASGINIKNGDSFQVQLAYDGTTLSVTIADQTTQATATQQYAVDIPSVVGSTTAYVGFTGGTGGVTAIQDILSWTYSN